MLHCLQVLSNRALALFEGGEGRRGRAWQRRSSSWDQISCKAVPQYELGALLGVPFVSSLLKQNHVGNLRRSEGLHLSINIHLKRIITGRLPCLATTFIPRSLDILRPRLLQSERSDLTVYGSIISSLLFGSLFFPVCLSLLQINFVPKLSLSALERQVYSLTVEDDDQDLSGLCTHYLDSIR